MEVLVEDMNEQQMAEGEDGMGRGVGAAVVVEEEKGIEVVIEIAGIVAEVEVVVGVEEEEAEDLPQTSMALQNDPPMVITNKTRGPCHLLLSLLLVPQGSPASMTHSRRQASVNNISQATRQCIQTTALAHGGMGSNTSSMGITSNTSHSMDSCLPRHSSSHISTPGSHQPLGWECLDSRRMPVCNRIFLPRASSGNRHLGCSIYRLRRGRFRWAARG